MAATIVLWGASTNLTANSSDPHELAFHITDSLAPIAYANDPNRAILEDTLGPDRLALDLGSGAGFPGLVLAAAFDAHFTLVEARRKRASHLVAAAAEMQLSNVGIEQRRAESEKIEGSFDIATARAFGPINHLCQAAASALRPGGYLMLYLSAGQLRSGVAAGFENFGEPSTWTYHLNHSGREVERAAMLLRKADIRARRI
jgi:16S rRNA (guanine527-N7)-methyltransferase